MALQFCILQIDNETFVAQNDAPVGNNVILPCHYLQDALIFCTHEKARHFADKIHLHDYQVLNVAPSDLR